jgi:hypothetical protein
MRFAPLALTMLLGATTPAMSQVHVNIGIDIPMYPSLQRVPGYPVYYAPGINSNYFFYDGLYWVYEGDNWYESTWYNGPWAIVDPFAVPLYLLRVPVRYYRHPPAYFRGWRGDAAPRWGDHWGRSWEEKRSGWNQWNRSSAPAPAPRPTYQRQYSGGSYPQAQQQAAIQAQRYSYQPHDSVAQQHFQQQRELAPAAREERVERPQPQAQERSQGRGNERGQGRDRERDNERGRDR